MTAAYDVVGLIGSLIISAGLVPQVAKVFRTKSATDISYSFLAMYNTGLVCILIYGIGESLYPIYVPCLLELVGALSLLVMKVLYRKTDSDVDDGSKGISEAPETPTSARFLAALTPK